MSPLKLTEFDEALKSALAWLAGRDRSEHELRERLKAQGSTAETSGAVIESLIERGIVDDLRLASRLVEQAASTKGVLRIRLELQKRRICEATANAALDALDGQFELKLAKDLLNERFAGSREVGRASRFLARRGFAEEAVREAVEQHFQLPDS